MEKGTPPQGTKDRILEAAWALFQKQGYEETTITQILAASGTSRTAFYHHFPGKDEILFSIAYHYDTGYEEWLESVDPGMHTVDKLKAFNICVMKSVEESVYRPFYPMLYGLQVMTSGTRHILNPTRKYYHITSLLIREGLLKNELETSYTYKDLTDQITGTQIGLTYAWCLSRESYSLSERSGQILDPLLESLRRNRP